MATFTVRPQLGGAGYYVTGTDDEGNTGSTVLFSDQWDMYTQALAFEEDSAEFSDLVQSFFAPITEKAQELRARRAQPGSDFTSAVVKAGQEFEPEVKATFDAEGTVLNILSQGRFDLLRWVGTDILIAVQP
jgi:hypothetical protein